MSKEYKAIVKWSGNHYHSGQEVTGSRVKQEKDGTVYLFDDEEKFFPNLGEVPPRNKWVQVEHQSLKQMINGEWQGKDFKRIYEEPNPETKESTMTYTKEDCIKETKEHIQKVKDNIHDVTSRLEKRAEVHDQSKMEQPELDIFVEYTPKLKNTTFGSDEYKENLKGMGEALVHHYKVNSHHPEHYDNGIGGMCLLDLIEMLSDWKAAVERHKNGDIRESLKINKERYSISDQLYEVLLNTIERMDW